MAALVGWGRVRSALGSYTVRSYGNDNGNENGNMQGVSIIGI